jgi:hypothetical protein
MPEYIKPEILEDSGKGQGSPKRDKPPNPTATQNALEATMP